MLRLFHPIPVKGKKPARQVRHFHFGFGPSVADPAGLIDIVETSSERDPQTNEAMLQVWWGGWRARFIVWLIGKLLPTPTSWLDTQPPKSAVRWIPPDWKIG